MSALEQTMRDALDAMFAAQDRVTYAARAALNDNLAAVDRAQKEFVEAVEPMHRAIDALRAALDAGQARQPLTDEQIASAFRAEGFNVITLHETEIAMRCARAIERAHGIT